MRPNSLPPPITKRVVYLDIMMDGRFVGQLPYTPNPLRPLTEEQAVSYVVDKRPSLRGKKFRIQFSSNRVY